MLTSVILVLRGEESSLAVSHRCYSIVLPLARYFLVVWLPTNEENFRMLLAGPIIANTFFSLWSTYSFCEFVVWKLGPITLVTLASARDVPGLHSMTATQIGVLGVSAGLLAPAVHGCVHAWRRRDLYAPVAGGGGDGGTPCDPRDPDGAWRSKIEWRIGTVIAVFLTFTALLFPAAELQATAVYLSNVGTDFERRVFTFACVAALSAWRGYDDYMRNKEPAPEEVRARRERAMADIRFYMFWGMVAWTPMHWFLHIETTSAARLLAAMGVRIGALLLVCRERRYERARPYSKFFLVFYVTIAR